jgi:hypothetical protein
MCQLQKRRSATCGAFSFIMVILASLHGAELRAEWTCRTLLVVFNASPRRICLIVERYRNSTVSLM